MKPGIYAKAAEEGSFMTLFPDMKGWNWEKFQAGHQDFSSIDGWKFVNSRGDWTFRNGVHDKYTDSYVAPFELVRW